MQKAKQNVEKEFAVVGIFEQLNQTFTVLENYIPRFFKGALSTYWEKVDDISMKFRKVKKSPVSEKVMNMVRQNFTHEIEFYEFCKQRLEKQYISINP